MIWQDLDVHLSFSTKFAPTSCSHGPEEVATVMLALRLTVMTMGIPLMKRGKVCIRDYSHRELEWMLRIQRLERKKCIQKVCRGGIVVIDYVVPTLDVNYS